MAGVRYVSAWDTGLTNLGAHWVRDDRRSRGENDTLNRLMQPDHVIRVDGDGLVHDDVSGMYAPDISIGTASDGISILKDHEEEFIRDMVRGGWSVEVGWSGQDSGRYNGPIMGDGEFIGGSLAEHVLTTPGYWVASSAATVGDSEDEGWVIMHHPEYVEKTDLLGRITRGRVVSNIGVRFTVEWEDGSKTTEQYLREGSDWREAAA